MRPMMEEFMTMWNQRVINYHSRSIENRLTDMRSVYAPLVGSRNQNVAAMAKRTVASIDSNMKRLTTDLKL